jgi:hypothetical protein
MAQKWRKKGFWRKDGTLEKEGKEKGDAFRSSTASSNRP